MNVWNTDMARFMAGLMLMGTLLGAAFLLRSTPFLRGSKDVLDNRKTNPVARVTWPAAIMLTQFWTVGVLLFPAWFYAEPLPGGNLGWEWVQWIGVVVWGGGGLLALWAARSLGRFLRPQIQVEKKHRLVQEGPYNHVRHPLYTANVMVGLGTGMAFLSLPVMVLTLIILILARYRAGLEEELLSSPLAFDGAYDEYARRTGRFLPIVGRRH